MKHGHSASDSWWHRSDDKNDGEQGANLASYGVDTNWYPDTGATDHITSELNKLLIANKYYGQDQVRTAEAQVCTLVISVIQYCAPLMFLLISKIFCMFLVHQRIFYLFISLPLIIMSLLSSILSSF
jgi:hypothetical protein